MISSSLFASREASSPPSHDCFKYTMKTVETVMSVALFIIGILAIFSYWIPPAAAYALAWVSGGWALISLASFFIPFLCRARKSTVHDFQPPPSTGQEASLQNGGLHHQHKGQYHQSPFGSRPSSPRPDPFYSSNRPEEGVKDQKSKLDQDSPYFSSDQGYCDNPPSLFGQNTESRPTSPRSMQSENIPIIGQLNGPFPNLSSTTKQSVVDNSERVKVLIMEATAYIQSLGLEEVKLEAELTEDFERVRKQNLSDEDKCLMLEKMYEALPYYLGEKSYPHSEFPIIGFSNLYGYKSHLNAALQVMIHSRSYDYILCRPFRMPKDSPPLQQLVNKCSPSENENEFWQAFFEKYPDDQSLMLKFNEIISRLRSGLVHAVFDLPYVGKGYHTWWLDRLGIDTKECSKQDLQSRILERTDWSVLILDNKTHCKVVVKKAEWEWYEINDGSWYSIPADYSALINKHETWQFYLLE